MIIDPDGEFKKIWDMTVLLVTIYSAIIIPLSVIFKVFGKPYDSVSIWIVTLVYTADVVINFYTSIPGRGTLIHDRRIIAGKYLKSWFAIDVLAAFPVPLVGVVFPAAGVLNLLRVLRLNRLFKLMRISRSLKRLSGPRMNPAIFRLVLLVFWIMMAAHTIACGWIIMTGNPGSLSPVALYIRAFYWTTTTLTTIGYGDVLPAGTKQTLYVIIIEIIGAGMYGLIIGNIANLIANIDVAKAQHREKMEKLNTFLRYRNIPMNISRKINDYFEYLWQTRRGYEESDVLKELPPSLKTWVALFLNKEVIEKVPIFEGASQEFIKETILHLTPIVFTPGDYIVTAGEVGYDMFFISKGTVDVVSADGTTTYATLSEGQFFGEIALLLSMPRTASIIARDYCDLYRLDKETFDRILARYPSFATTIRELAEKRREEINASKIKKGKKSGIKEEKEYSVPDKIKGLAIKVSGSVVMLNWEGVEDFGHYEVARRKHGAKRWVYLDKNLQVTRYSDRHYEKIKYPEYRVRAVNMSGPGPWSDIVALKKE